MKTLILDLETTINCPVGNNKANPMWRGNKIIAAGYVVLGTSAVVTHYSSGGLNEEIIKDKCDISNVELLVGQNIKFDLLYLYRGTPTAKLPRIWDTQLAAYLLSCQQHQYASLDELTMEYIGKEALKDDKIKGYWKEGIPTEKIPSTELCAYLRKDVENTEAIFKRQFVEAEELGIMELMLTQMDALRATIVMNLHGMAVDWNYVTDKKKELEEKITSIENTLKEFEPDLDYMSNKELSLHFFGGDKKIVRREPVGFYKNGNPKFKNVESILTIKGRIKPFGEVGKSGYYSVDDSVLTQIMDDKIAPVHPYDHAVAHSILQLRKLKKIKETYYEGLSSLRFPRGLIYPNLNHCATKTGRLTATNPNLQNQTDEGGVKAAYVSRFPNGKILELDYSQLEMVALAYLADDKQLIEDINNGRDMHRELYNGMYGRYPTDAERKPFKRFSFLLVYGGGVPTLMAQSGCDKATAKKFIDTFYSRYKGVKKYHEQIVKDAVAKAVVEYSPTTSGPQYVYYHRSPTGRHYMFKKYPNEYKKGEMTFSPTELKNWPIQGFATGDVVPMMVGILLRKLEEANIHDQALLVMTVHDSVVLDTTEEMLYKAASIAKKTLEDAPKYLKMYFDIDFPCQLKVGVEAGDNWQNKEELTV